VGQRTKQSRAQIPWLSAFLLAAALLVSALEACAEKVKFNEPDFLLLPGQRLLLKGDSIVKGYAFGNYTNSSPLRTLYGIASVLLKENLPFPPQAGLLPPVWAGLDSNGIPVTVDTLGGEIQVNIRKGDLRPGDWLIYEDAGELDKVVHPPPWPSATNMYQKQREAIRTLVLEAENCIGREHVRLMTMFDYDPKYPLCKWDEPLDDHQHSGNDAIRDEAAALGVGVIDMNEIMDQAEAYIVGSGWGRLVGADGIHPNVYGNCVMSMAILRALGADLAQWSLKEAGKHFLHPAAGGDVEEVWGFVKDPSDRERLEILKDLRGIVAKSVKPNAPVTRKDIPSAGHTFTALHRHGRILAQPLVQPEGTTKPCSYELGKLFQLDHTNVLLIASLREQGGHDFEVGNDGFVFQRLSDIVPDRAFPVNRLEPDFKLPDQQKSVLAKFPVNGAFMPRGALLANGRLHPAGGTGFLLSTAAPFLPDRSEMVPKQRHFLEFLQTTWDGKTFTTTKDALPEPYASTLMNAGFNCIPDGEGFLCPLVSDDGIVVLRFEFAHGKWRPTSAGKTFSKVKGEVEPSLRKSGEDYLVYTRGSRDRRGRVYRSHDGLNYHLAFDHWNYTVPQALNQGLDGSLYLCTNIGPGWLRNPLLGFALRGQSFVNPIIIHDEKQIGDDTGPEVPFCDHAIAQNVCLDGKWRHLLLYRVCDLKETNGKGAPPFAQTGLYLAEFEYSSATSLPFRF
jgi:hypothetical protein